MLAAVVALAAGCGRRCAVYGLIALVLVLGQAGYYHSKPRLLVPVLLILRPAGDRRSGGRRPRTAALVLIAAARRSGSGTAPT